MKIEKDRETTEKRLLTAVGEIIEESGLESLGVNAVAQRAGVSKMLIYRYFGSLEDLIAQYIIQRDYWVNIPTEIPGKNELNAFVKDMFREQIRQLREDKMLIRLYRWELSVNNPIVEQIRRKREENGIKLIEFISRISNRHFGIGGDGMIVILKSDQYDFKMRMFNLDGSEGMMCGNGIRCFAKFCYDHHLTDKKVLNIETKAGLRIVELIFDGDEVVGAKVDMQEPILNCKDIPVIFDQEKMINEKVMIGDQEYALTAVSMGNPHVITYVDSLDFDIETIGKQFEHHQIFPESVNTEFVEVINDHYLKMRVWERGSGETMACGTGACAVMYASYLNGYCKEKATVELLGGKLEIDLQEGHIFMTGPATTVFEGKIKI